MKTTGRRILYIDPFSGVSGDMFLGAFLSVGVPLEIITDAVEAVIPGEVELSAHAVARSGLAGITCDVKVVGGPGSRTLDQMKECVRAARLPDAVVRGALRTLDSLGDAERKAHGKPEGPVHLHELGGQDTLADIVGALAALDHLGPDEVLCGAVNVGSGYVQTSHGMMPVPAPATAHLLEGVAVFSQGPAAELTTPTGAAILREIVDGFGPMGAMTIHLSGCGAGSADFEGFPNLLRIFRGEESRDPEEHGAVIIECGIDDMSPEYLAPVTGALQAAGAREVHVIPAFTKKGRMGVLLRILAMEGERQSLIDVVLETSGSAGLRYWRVGRSVLERETVTVKTPFGPVSFKRWRTPSGQWRFKPEFEDVQRLAEKAGIPAATMRERVVAAYISEVENGQEED
ncbi:MAG: nickel pincer cofactor biosynthesis protein LarC [bacterium]|nr:MAG: nickel pincer cofactor biosynthesis protein LarC [bacterium]